MPKRNRAQEVRKHGHMIETWSPPEQKLAIVDDSDLIKLGGLALWAHRYVNYVYKNGDIGGGSLLKNIENIRWTHGELSYQYRDCFSASSSSRGDLKPSLGTIDAEYEEIKRQRADGLVLRIDTQTMAQPTDDRSTSESLRVVLDADGGIVSGGYSWYGPDLDKRPAPDAQFSGIESAHKATVSNRAGVLLGRFRDLVLMSPDEVRTEGIWNSGLSVTPPDILRPVPDFKV